MLTLMAIRVVLAEANALLREGVSRLVASQADLELVGVAHDLPSLLAIPRSRNSHMDIPRRDTGMVSLALTSFLID